MRIGFGTFVLTTMIYPLVISGFMMSAGIDELTALLTLLFLSGTTTAAILLETKKFQVELQRMNEKHNE